MNKEENSDSISTDLILEILSRLPAKSIGRFRCVSKLWGSMLSRPYFTELFLTSSSTRPRLLFAFQGADDWSFYSSPQPHNPYGKSFLVAAADFHMKFCGEMYQYGNCAYASGLLCFLTMPIPKKVEDIVPLIVICNPSMGQYAILPELTEYRMSKSFLGFDPIDKQFKVLLMSKIYCNGRFVHHILTLGTGKIRWRYIQCPLTHEPLSEGICIDGVLYYSAQRTDVTYVIVCFDVRSEKFKFIDAECFYYQLINYKGKLAGIKVKYGHYGGYPVQLCMWVLDDVEEHEWSKYVYILWALKSVVKNCDLSVVGMTARGEIVLSMDHISKPFYVFYFNPERNTLLSVEIEGFGEYKESFNNHRVYAFVDHVEDLKFNTMNTTDSATSISPPEQSTSTLSREDH